LLFPGISYAANVARSPRVAAAQRAWVDAIKAVGMTPDLQSGLSWDPALIVVDALRHVGPNPTPDAIRSYIEGLHDFAGISGMYDFRAGNQRGIGVDDVVMIRFNPSDSAWIAASKPGGTLR
jgi:branched-chain amino acid transport system substrate-binding protein